MCEFVAQNAKDPRGKRFNALRILDFLRFDNPEKKKERKCYDKKEAVWQPDEVQPKGINHVMLPAVSERIEDELHCVSEFLLHVIYDNMCCDIDIMVLFIRLIDFFSCHC